jgi:HD-GYP domain-containing protein (c-di-GMP phosphodiesterase class II)
MNILLVHPQKDVIEMVGFCLESRLDINLLRASNFGEAIQFFLEDGAVDMVITAGNADATNLYKYMLSIGSKAPVLLIEDVIGQSEAFPEINIVGRMTLSGVPDQLFTTMQTTLAGIPKKPIDREYCRISTELLVRVVPLRGDIYIRLSNIKYVKMFRSGAQFTKEDLENYVEKKKIPFLYVKSSESAEFVAKFKDELADLVQTAMPEDLTLVDTINEVQELVHELATRLGFTEEVQELARSNVQLALKTIGSSPKLAKILGASQLSSRNYISSHSVALANVACAIASKMNWPSKSTFHKLVVASFFHDFSFTESRFAKVESRAELDGMKGTISEEHFKEIFNHPMHASNTVKQINEIPPDVDVIIMQHHERADGTGFPKGMRGTQIAPLASVFIVAHDIVSAMSRDEFGFSLSAFLDRNEGLYHAGTFKNIWKMLRAQEVELSASKPAA